MDKLQQDKDRNRSTNKILLTEKEFGDKLVTENGASTDELIHAVGALAWANILTEVYGDGNPDREPLDDVDRAVREVFMRWADKNRLDDLNDLLIVESDGAPLAGRPMEAAIKARSLVQATEFRQQRLAGLLHYTLAPTLRGWEAQGTATPEEMGDFLLPSLGGDAPTPQPTGVLAEFGARLWWKLQSQEERDIDYWKTVRAFGDFFVRAKGRNTLSLATTAYHTLIEAQWQYAEDEEAAELIGGAANNLTSLFDDLAGKMPNGEVVLGIATASRLHMLVSGAVKGRYRLSSGRRRALALDGMGNTPSAFQQVGTDSLELRYLRQAWFSARTAVARARLREPTEEDAKDIASAFFNAGVAVIRRGSRRAPDAVVARIVLNALGLWWALHMAPDDDVKALGPYNGGDCAVNLFGALTDLNEEMIEKFRAVLEPLWASLHAQRNVLGSADARRIENSAGQMKLGEVPSPLDSDSLRRTVANFLSEAGSLMALPWLARLPNEAGDAKDERARQLSASLSWRVVKKALHPLLKGRYIELCQPVWKALNSMQLRLDELPEKIDGDWRNFLEGRHPLVAAGLMKQEEIETLLDAGKDDSDSLGGWMEKHAWELAGALAR